MAIDRKGFSLKIYRNREAASVMHEQMQKNEEKYAAIEDPEGTSREIGITAVKIQDMQAKRCVLGL